MPTGGQAQSLTTIEPATLAPAARSELIAALAVMLLTLPNYLENGDTLSWLGFGGGCGGAAICATNLPWFRRKHRTREEFQHRVD